MTSSTAIKFDGKTGQRKYLGGSQVELSQGLSGSVFLTWEVSEWGGVGGLNVSTSTNQTITLPTAKKEFTITARYASTSSVKFDERKSNDLGTSYNLKTNQITAHRWDISTLANNTTLSFYFDPEPVPNRFVLLYEGVIMIDTEWIYNGLEWGFTNEYMESNAITFFNRNKISVSKFVADNKGKYQGLETVSTEEVHLAGKVNQILKKNAGKNNVTVLVYEHPDVKPGGYGAYYKLW
ncbi:MAG: hypothetical protein ACOX0W_02195 [Sphaerochaetaceae bacterium]|nr:hypothetical protein [Candidatus Cloacimonadota bacterium]